MKKLLVIILFLLPHLASSQNINENKKLISQCLEVNKASDELDKWTTPALQSNSGIGCPSLSSDSPLSKLEILSQQNGECGQEALGTLIGFYAIFTNHPNYTMCGLVQKQDVILARAAVDGKVCTDQPVNQLTSCFLQINKMVVDLKTRGEMRSAFELANKTANSNDVTGISQMTLGTMYGYGAGTDKNLSLAVKWLRDSLEKIGWMNDKKIRINILILLSVFSEELGDYKNAKQYAQLCAIMGDISCKKGLVRLKSAGH